MAWTPVTSSCRMLRCSPRRVLACPGAARARIARQADQAPGAVPGRRRGRHRGAGRRGQARGRSRQADRGREQGRRRRHHRDRRASPRPPPDGYTLLLTTPNHTINAALQPTLPYDTEKDIAPVSIVAEVPEVLVSHPGAPFATFPEFVAYAKAESRQAQLFLRRHRHAAARDHGTAAAADRHRGRAHSLPRRRARDERPAVRPGAAQARHLRDLEPACRRRQAPHARHRQRSSAPS